MDKYTKIVLTVIALGIVGLNIQLSSGLIGSAYEKVIKFHLDTLFIYCNI